MGWTNYKKHVNEICNSGFASFPLCSLSLCQSSTNSNGAQEEKKNRLNDKKINSHMATKTQKKRVAGTI